MMLRASGVARGDGAGGQKLLTGAGVDGTRATRSAALPPRGAPLPFAENLKQIAIHAAAARGSQRANEERNNTQPELH
jgi:hypothetical protein